MVKVRILGMVITHQYGTLNTGDILQTTPEFAKHLVDDCAAAEYVKPEQEEGADVKQQSGGGRKASKGSASKIEATATPAAQAPVAATPPAPEPQPAPAVEVQTSAQPSADGSEDADKPDGPQQSVGPQQ